MDTFPFMSRESHRQAIAFAKHGSPRPYYPVATSAPEVLADSSEASLEHLLASILSVFHQFAW